MLKGVEKNKQASFVVPLNINILFRDNRFLDWSPLLYILPVYQNSCWNEILSKILVGGDSADPHTFALGMVTEKTLKKYC